MAVRTKDVTPPIAEQTQRTALFLGGSIKYNKTFTYVDKQGMTKDIKPSIKVTGIDGLKWPTLSLSPSMIKTIVNLYNNDPLFKSIMLDLEENGSEVII